MTSMAMTMFIALSFSASAQSFTVPVTNNTSCDMTVVIVGSSQLSPCTHDLGEGVALIPSGMTVNIAFLDGGRPVQAYLTGGGAMATDNNGVAQGSGAAQELCGNTSVPGAGLACVGFTVTITGQTMTID